MKPAKWSMQINFPTFQETYPRKGLLGGGIHIFNQDRSISFMTTFHETDRQDVERTSREVLEFLNR